MLTRNRVFGALLLISWTLNVVLIVALYYSRHRPPFHRPPFGPPDREMFDDGPPGVPGHPGMPPEMREMLHQNIKPMIDEQHNLAGQLYSTLIADSLDTAKVERLSDSLSQMRCQIQKTMIDRISGLHGNMSPEQRRKFYSRVIGRMEHDRPGGIHRGRDRKSPSIP